MTPTRRSPKEIAAELRRLQERSDDDRDRLSLLHEVQVYQEELTVQNEELVRAQAELEETRDRFIELYDFAPNGYFTLDANGIVLQINLTGASILGRSKQTIEGMPLLGFIEPAHRLQFLDLMRRCRNGNGGTEAELTIRSGNGPRAVQLLCRPRHAPGSARREYFTSMVDVTDRKRLERERAKASAEYAALASRLLTVQDDERRRIARDLHDDIGQQATAVRLKLEEIGHAAGGEARGAIADALQMLEALDGRLHFIATELRPATLDLGIVAAIQQFVREWSANTGIAADFHSAGLQAQPIAPATETHVYRVAQEALNNVLRHAAARHVTVLLERKGDGVVLVIEDDGRGFDPAIDRGQGGGLGLLGMRERAQIVGGRIEIETGPGQGTSVYLRVPANRPPS